MKHVIWLVAVVACTEFESIDRGVCGNGLLETGEDCDSSDASCVSCAVTCAADADCPTTDYACGVDGLCHAPGGALARPQVLGAFEASEYHVTDIDQDGIGDALGASRSSLVVRYGDAAAPLSRVDSIVTPSQTGPASFGDLDGDGSTDVSILTLDGLVSYTSRYGRMSGLEVQSEIVEPGETFNVKRLFGIGPLMIGVFAEQGGKLLFAVVDFTASVDPIGGPPCGQSIPIADFDPENVDYYQIHRAGDASTEMVVSLVTGTGPAKKLCVVSIYKANLFAATQLTTITPPNLGLAKRPVLADLTDASDPCPSLVNTDGGVTQLRKWDGQRHATATYCTLGSTPNVVPALAGVPAATTVVGRVPIDPPAVLSAADALVIESGVHAFSPGFGSWVEVYRSTRPITGIGFGDLDSDGDLDAALQGAGDDIDVLLRTSTSALFQLFRIDTASEPELVVLDDYDGNGRIDIAYTEPVGANVRLMVSYGTADQPLPPIEVGRFAAVSSIARVKFPSSTDYLGLAADLILMLPGAPPRISILSGSTQRTMLSFFDPRANDGTKYAVQDTTLFRAAVIGEFTSASGEDYPDVVGLAALRDGVDTTQDQPSNTVPLVPMRAWSVRGSSTGLDGTQSDGIEVANVDDCSVRGGTGLCIDDARYIAWRAATNHDVVIAIDRQRQAAVFDPSAIGGSKLTATAVTLPIPDGSFVHSLHAGDVDGDESPELIAAFAPSTPMAASAILVCQVDGSGIPSACEDLLPVIQAAAPATVACLDAAPGKFGYRDPITAPSAARDVLVLCRDDGTTLHRVYRDADGLHAVPLARVGNMLTTLQIGDVTGDGIDDVVGLEGEPGSRTLVVFPQCTSRDATACQRSDTQGEGG